MINSRINKIKIVCTLPDLSGGGAERVMSILMMYLDSSKYEIHLVIGKFIGVNSKGIPNYIKIHELGNLRSKQIVIPLIKIIKKINPDYIIATLGFVNPVIIGKVFFSKKTKIIIRYGNTLGSFLSEIRSKSIIRYYFYYFLTYLVNHFSDIIISQCEFMKNDLIRTFNLNSHNIKKIVTIYNPVDLGKIMHLSLNNSLSKIDYDAKKGPFLISVGRLEWQKGFDYLINAIKKVKCAFPNVLLTIYGKGSKEVELKNLITKNDLEDNIKLMGFSSNPYFDLSKSDLFISSSRYEGFSNSIIESISLGVPVVATDCPSGVREIIVDGRNGWLSTFKNVDREKTLSETIIKALKSKDLLDKEEEKEKNNSKFGRNIFIKKVESLIQNATH